MSGYLFTPDIFDYLHRALEVLQPNQEFYQQTAMQMMINDGHQILACEIKDGKYYDTGNKLEYLKTIVEFGLNHSEIADDFRQYINSLYN